MEGTLMDIDRRTVDLTDQETQSTLTDEFKQWIDEAFGQIETENMVNIWQNNVLYTEGYQTPVGSTSDALSEFINENDDIIDKDEFRIQTQKAGKIYFVDNKLRAIVDGYVGDYTSAKKVLTVKTDANPRNDQIEYVVARYLDRLEKDSTVWENYRVPAIEYMSVLGLGWTEIFYNPYRRIAKGGQVGFKLHHPRNVGVDPAATEKYFRNAGYFVVKERLELNEARVYFQQFGIDPNLVSADLDFESQTLNANVADPRATTPKKIEKRQFVTIYRIFYRKPYLEEFNLREYHGIQGDPSGIESQNDIVNEEQMYYFNAIYNRHLGVVSHQINRYADVSEHDQWQFPIFPYYNRQSHVRTYPQSDIERLIVVQDIINITKSLILSNARDRNRVRLFIKKRIQEKFPDEFDRFLEAGGAFPLDDDDLGRDGDIRTAVQFLESPTIPKEVYNFLEIAEASLKDQSIRHESLQGSYPDKSGYLSGIAVKRLQMANKKLITFKDININWVVNQEARLIYKILAQEFNENDFIYVTDAKKTDAKYIPVNGMYNLEQYTKFLLGAYPELELEEAAQLFEEKNDVDIVYSLKSDGQTLRNMQEVMQKNSIVFVNYLKDMKGNPRSLDVSVEFEFNPEQKEMEQNVYRAELFSQGKYPLRRFFRNLGGEFKRDADEIIKELSIEQQERALAEAIVQQPPEVVEQIMKILSQVELKGKRGRPKKKQVSDETKSKIKKIESEK
jgi:hypothetical protein